MAYICYPLIYYTYKFIILVISSFYQYFKCFANLYFITHFTLPRKKYSYYIIPLIPAIFSIFSYPINYRPYWLFLPLLPGLLQCVLIILYKIHINHRLNTKDKLILILIGYMAFLSLQGIVFILIILIIIFITTIFLEKERPKIINDFSIVIFWLSLSFLLFMIPVFMTILSGLSFYPSYIYSYSVLEFMSIKANFLNALTFSIGYWEKVVYSNLDKVLTLLMVSFTVTIFSLIRKKDSLLLSIILIFIISIYLQIGINNPLYKLVADPSNKFAWIIRDPFKISLISLGIFNTIFAFAMKYIIDCISGYIKYLLYSLL